MSFPYFISPEQAMRERSELARKGISRGRSVVALAYSGGVLFVAENPSRSLQKVSELYDRVGFAAVGRFNEFDNLRRGGIQFADTRGYAYDRRDVTGRQLANVYAQTLGTIFTEQAKPYEVELCVAEVAHFGETKPPELYRITYDGSIADEPHFVVMGGTTEPIITALNDSYTENASLTRGGDHRRRCAAGRHRQQRLVVELVVVHHRTAEVGRVDARGRDSRRKPAAPRLPSHHGFRVGGAGAQAGGPGRSGIGLRLRLEVWRALEQHERLFMRSWGLRLPQCSRRRATRGTGTCASPTARRVKALGTSCSSRTGSRAARSCRSYRPCKGGSRR